MKTILIKINGTTVTLKFGYGFLRLLSQHWGLTGPAAVLEKFLNAARPLLEIYQSVVDDAEFDAKVASGKSVDLPFESIDNFVDVLIIAAKNQASDLAALDSDSVAEYLFSNPETMGEMTRLFLESMPQVKPGDVQGKQEPAIVPGQ